MASFLLPPVSTATRMRCVPQGVGEYAGDPGVEWADQDGHGGRKLRDAEECRFDREPDERETRQPSPPMMCGLSQSGSLEQESRAITD